MVYMASLVVLRFKLVTMYCRSQSCRSCSRPKASTPRSCCLPFATFCFLFMTSYIRGQRQCSLAVSWPLLQPQPLLLLLLLLLLLPCLLQCLQPLLLPQLLLQIRHLLLPHPPAPLLPMTRRLDCRGAWKSSEQPLLPLSLLLLLLPCQTPRQRGSKSAVRHNMTKAIICTICAQPHPDF